ncbi:hypothetical protein BH23PLA1_BH23PLA1_13510 [soil metagenome]
MSTNPIPDRDERRKRITAAESLQALLDQPDGEVVLEAEADDPTLSDSERLITRTQLEYLLAIREHQRRAGARLSLFFSTDDVIIVPGFMGSSLRDVDGRHGLIWIDPKLVISGDQLNALKLATFAKGLPERDATEGVRIASRGPLPAIYDLMAADLELRRYSVEIHAFDWRKDIEQSSLVLANRIRARLGRKPRPLHLIAHSQGTLVARRAIQILGAVQARRLVNNLVLLGPATYGTFSAAFALAGTHESLDTARQYRVKLPSDFEVVMQSFTGLYQLLPWNPALFSNGFNPKVMQDAKFWKKGAQKDRLGYGFGWGKQVDAAFFHDRTVIILGDRPTVGAAAYVNGDLHEFGPRVPGDGTVPDTLAMLPGVRSYRVAGASHLMLPMNLSVMGAVRAILKGATPRVDLAAFHQTRSAFAAAKKSRTKEDKQYALLLQRLGLEPPVPLAPPPRPTRTDSVPETRSITGRAPSAKEDANVPPSIRPEPPAPPYRRLRVFSFDPLLATNLDMLEIAELTLQVPWERTVSIKPGPVGEYLEVVDYDPASQAFYHPVDLTHPRITAQDGLPPSESNPQFHQQMVYAVAMSTIATFEKALGRVALWAPRFERDADGKVIPQAPEEHFVPRLRIYPHALREANAYYDPERHALLFGYFPSQEHPGGETLPGGTVFTCLSFDIIAHETTHALLHGLHRYYLEPSNPDVLAFHEAFADAVALFQHFSHTEVLVHQVARTRGDFRRGSLLGQLARQFGSALGPHRGALRRYVDTEPDPTLYQTTDRPHERGAILMAALFRAFVNIFEKRARDLYRIATGGTGLLPDGDIHPDLANRLAAEAAKSAQHLLTMCVRALDYVPPVDLTFGEFLRALITADYDLVRNDDRGYRVSVIDAFRSWGLYPSDVNVLDQAALLWQRPDAWARDALRDKVRELDFPSWNLRADRREVFLQMERNRFQIRNWLYQNARESGDGGNTLGIMVIGSGVRSIPRNHKNAPVFEVHSIRPCSRIGPDGQQRVDLVAEIVQRRAGYFDEKIQQQVDSATGKEYWAFTKQEQKMGNRPLVPQPPDFWFRGGGTLIIDPDSGEIRYCISKSVSTKHDTRLHAQRFYERTGAFPSAADTYFGSRGRNPFALLHTDE